MRGVRPAGRLQPAYRWQNRYDGDILAAVNIGAHAPSARLLKNLMAQESQFNPETHDDAAYGLTQLTREAVAMVVNNDENWKGKPGIESEIERRFELIKSGTEEGAQEAIVNGARYLAVLHEIIVNQARDDEADEWKISSEESWKLTVAAYNAGANRILAARREVEA